jgi:hypothetical protein
MGSSPPRLKERDHVPQAPVEAPAIDRAVGSERPGREAGPEPQDAEPSRSQPGAGPGDHPTDTR